MTDQDVLNDGKAQASASLVLRAPIVNPIKPLGQAGQVFGLNPLALIMNMNFQDPTILASI